VRFLFADLKSSQLEFELKEREKQAVKAMDERSWVWPDLNDLR
jgi:hypothetical protein